jgi:hypothetical protein
VSDVRNWTGVLAVTTWPTTDGRVLLPPKDTAASLGRLPLTLEVRTEPERMEYMLPVGLIQAITFDGPLVRASGVIVMDKLADANQAVHDQLKAGRPLPLEATVTDDDFTADAAGLFVLGPNWAFNSAVVGLQCAAWPEAHLVLEPERLSGCTMTLHQHMAGCPHVDWSIPVTIDVGKTAVKG